MVDHVHVGVSCTCPSRRTPCKHALALLLLWVRGQVADAVAPPPIEAWATKRAQRFDRTPTTVEEEAGRGDDGAGADGTASGVDETTATSETPTGDVGDDAPTPLPVPEPDRDAARDDRVARMYAGLTELDRWLDDRIRTGLADPSLASYATWDSLAARLVDAQAGSLANRIRRLAGLVGASPDWHDDVLAELGLLHLLSQAGRRLGSLPGPLADAVATSVGWQVRKADVIAGVPDTDRWVVAGRSDLREDRIEVRRHWLRGITSGRWALSLSFAAYQQSLDTSLVVGTSIHADIHRYPGPALRAIVGLYHEAATGPVAPPANTIAGACDELGLMLAAEPWLDRLPTTVHAAVSRSAAGWVLADQTGSLPLLDLGSRQHDASLSMLLAVSQGRSIDLTIEWTPLGVIPLSVHLADRSIDIGPRADDSFVSAA